jgi:ribosomal protein L2
VKPDLVVETETRDAAILTRYCGRYSVQRAKCCFDVQESALPLRRRKVSPHRLAGLGIRIVRDIARDRIGSHWTTAHHNTMLQPRICQFQPSRLGRALLSARTYAQAAARVPPPTLKPAVPAEGSVVTGGGSRKDQFIPLRTYKPRTPGLRHLKRPVNDHLWPGRPHLALTFARKGQHLGGRNNTGRVTVRHRGGGHKRRIRIVDYKRYLPGKHVVERIEYDPNRSAHLALVTRVATGEKSYIIAADGMRAGDEVESYRLGIPDDLIASMGGGVDPGMLAAKTAARGNCLPIHMVPLGSQIFNIGSKTQGGGVFCRSAGTYALVVNKEEVEKPKGTEIKSVIIRLQSGEIRKVSPMACCTIGVASNPQAHFAQLGKAGRSRWLGRRPEVRGLAMNAGQSPVYCYYVGC